VRILVVADGLEPLLHHTVVGLADRGHDVRVIGAANDAELDATARFRLGSRLRVTADRDRTSSWASAARTVTALGRIAAGKPGVAASVVRSARSSLGPGPDFRRHIAQVVPVLAERADVVYFEAAYVAAEVASVLDHLPPYVVMCTGSDLRILPEFNRNLRRLLPGVFAGAARIVCRSEDLREWAVRRGALPQRTTVLYPAVELDKFAPASSSARSSGPMRMVSVGRLHWVKGYEYAVQATHLALRKGHDLTYTIVGRDDGTGQAIDIAIRDLGLGDWVRRVGAKDTVGVARAMARSDVFVLPSVGEGVSRAALEAMAAGLPVITTDAGGMTEVITDGVDGIVVPQRDPAALADAMSSLACDPDRREAMSARAAARARDFGAVAHLDRLEALLVEYAEVQDSN
jgi:glycosyltransferase involved in cell wall biosynthesis